MPKTRPFQGVTLDTIKETRGTSLPVTFSVPKIYCLPLSILLLSTSSAIQHYKYPDHLHILILPLDSGSAVLDDLKYSTAPQMERVILFILLVASTSCQTRRTNPCAKFNCLFEWNQPTKSNVESTVPSTSKTAVFRRP
jgi:hypothetical protein